MLRRLFITAVQSLVLVAPAQAITVDGEHEGDYGPVRATQACNTSFGHRDLPSDVRYSSGSEDVYAFGTVQDGVLYLMFVGTLRSDFTNLEVFLDCVPGGQTVLRPDNANVDDNGLNRMAGMSFDTAFSADYYLTFSCGDVAGAFGFYGYFADLPSTGGGIPTFLGVTDATVTGGGNPLGVQFAIENGNTMGLQSGCSPASFLNSDPSGIELGIPLASIGSPSGCIEVTAFVNRPNHDFVSNQVLAPLPAGYCDLGDPSLVSFALIPGDQFFTVCTGSTRLLESTWGKLKLLYR